MNKYKETAQFVLSLAKEKGADKAVCALGENQTQEFNVDGNEFSLFRTLFDKYLSITVFKDNKKGSVSINKFDKEEIIKAVDNCISAAESASPDESWEIAENIGEKHFESGAVVPDTEKLFMRCKEFMEDIKEQHPLILMEQMIVSHKGGKSLYLSSTGNEYYTQKGSYGISLMFSGHKGDKSTSFYGSDAVLDNLDKPFIDCAMFRQELTDIENQIETGVTESKFEGTVIFTPACVLSTVFYNIYSNFASDSSILEGTSLWKDKIGQIVADERINVSFKPHDSRIICGQNYTGEGFIAEDCDFIKNGKLERFMISQYVANKTNNKRGPNSSFSIVIESGNTSLSEMIKNVDKGVIIGRFSGGSPGANGEFSGVAKNGFMIENGKITHALSETMISGNLADMLFNLVDISQETLIDGSVVAPYMAFKGITISGK